MAIPAESSKRVPPQRARRLQIRISGLVQGVGFRPFVFRIANDLGIRGSVANTPQGVIVDAEATRDRLQAFLLRIETDKPPLASIRDLECRECVPGYAREFRILASEETGARTTGVIADIAVCSECLAEMHDPANRRYRYPFINCTHCGPRYSIVHAVPYDRANTSMRGFEMCADCRREYESPGNRRFHAQPIACPVCGPQVALWSANGNILSGQDRALDQTVAALEAGAIVAVKGLGGFHLMVDATNRQAVRNLRERKHREAKPLAVMVPNLAVASALARVDDADRAILASPESPILLLDCLPNPCLAPEIAPGCPTLGIMLPYTPLHHLLMDAVARPLVATSGNLSEEPICIEENEALERLCGIADCFLVHNRPILRPLDDSVVRRLHPEGTVLRRARGFAPLSLALPDNHGSASYLCLGAHERSTVALSCQGMTHLSQHLGDLHTTLARRNFADCIADMEALYNVSPDSLVCDRHPDYGSTLWAEASGKSMLRVQHHHAHVLSCMAEHGLPGPVLGVAWDGSGLGDDGTIWGGEFLDTEVRGFQRVAHLRPFSLPGGDAAIREPWRVALALLHEARLLKDDLLSPLVPAGRSHADVQNLLQMVQRGIHATRTTSAGRLFDGLAALIGLCHESVFEGQAPMALEAAAAPWDVDVDPWPMPLNGTGLDWAPMLQGVIADLAAGVSVAHLAWRIHRTLAEGILCVARHCGRREVVLTGGCFQNGLLTRLTTLGLTNAGYRVHLHRGIPPNDGGISVGQALFAAYQS
ncbi:MAG: carbamoyltransferase HypF [Candidatus Hydrogenedentes bacterium]|nr:carbamoyltransferase HypF [Candidatus Hydrogenedentota bacterium]